MRNTNDDDDNYETITGRDGKTIRVLKDGSRTRVSMIMRDSLTPLQRAVHDAHRPVTVVDTFGNDGLALHQPGYRYLNAAPTTPEHAVLATHDAIRATAYDEMVRDMCDAWRTPNDADNPKPVVLTDPQQIRDAAYEDYCKRTAEAWRS
jgi:hypothetical protein